MNACCKVSVVIPVYGVEQFVGRCVRSLMEQTLDSVEFIFVDDATCDGSVGEIEKVIAHYPSRSSQVRILHHEYNLGLPAARNTGLGVASGEYVFHCDGDDYADREMLSQMYAFAKKGDYDIVWADWFLTYTDCERYMSQPSYSNPMDALKSMLSGGMKYNVWNKLVKRTVYTDNGIEFPAGYGMGEDMTMMMLFACSNRVGYLQRAYYHAVKSNVTAFSQTYSRRHREELKHNVQRVLDYMHNRFGDNMETELNFFCLEAKFPFLIMGDSEENYRLWTSWYPESNRYICANTRISWRSRMLQWCAWKRQWWLVSLYYRLIIDGLYRAIYR